VQTECGEPVHKNRNFAMVTANSKEYSDKLLYNFLPHFPSPIHLSPPILLLKYFLLKTNSAAVHCFK
jgi:hypothetical protein